MTDQEKSSAEAPPPKLTPRQRAQLKSIGQNQKPLLMIGKDGLTDTVLTQLEALIERHELVKIKLLNTVETDRHELAAELETKARAQLVQVIGRMVLMYRRHPKKPKLLVATGEGD
jgi:RNA-binding protein